MGVPIYLELFPNALAIVRHSKTHEGSMLGGSLYFSM